MQGVRGRADIFIGPRRGAWSRGELAVNVPSARYAIVNRTVSRLADGSRPFMPAERQKSVAQRVSFEIRRIPPSTTI
jgi:hypothetical protein